MDIISLQNKWKLIEASDIEGFLKASLPSMKIFSRSLKQKIIEYSFAGCLVVTSCDDHR